MSVEKSDIEARPVRDAMSLTKQSFMANTYTQLHIQFVFAVQNRMSLMKKVIPSLTLQAYIILSIPAH